MSIERLRDEVYKKKIKDEDVINGMNNTVAFLLQQAWGKVQNGEIEIKDPTDIARLWNIMEKTTNYNSVMENAENNTNSQLPALTTKEARALGVTQSISEDGEVTTEDIDESNIEAQDVDSILSNLSDAMNDSNVNEMGE
jgi:hypothetical protein